MRHAGAGKTNGQSSENAWAIRRGGPTLRLHSCGNVAPFVAEFVDAGIDCLNPLEVKAGMDLLAVKREFGDRLVIHGGINAMLLADLNAVEAEVRRLMPELKAGGGLIFSSDHSIPDDVPLANCRRIVELAKELGTY